jgi:hypothetical protein
MKPRPTSKKLHHPQLPPTVQAKIEAIFERGGIFSVEIQPMTHEYRVFVNISDTYCYTGSLDECRKIAESALIRPTTTKVP